ncbi:MAG: CZB domain-containing protein [Sandaracinaceae bacterium]|jgi:hypothetical protein|nr:CZB domain-containing protein [Sandaracinaceae bacterium]
MSSLTESVDKAIAAHGMWKVKFKQMVAGEAKIDAALTRRCDACEFGKWLGAEGKSSLGASYDAVYQAHQRFHTVAADVVEAHNRGQSDAVTAALHHSGEFAKAGAALTNLLSKLKAS